MENSALILFRAMAGMEGGRCFFIIEPYRTPKYRSAFFSAAIVREYPPAWALLCVLLFACQGYSLAISKDDILCPSSLDVLDTHREIGISVLFQLAVGAPGNGDVRKVPVIVIAHKYEPVSPCIATAMDLTDYGLCCSHTNVAASLLAPSVDPETDLLEFGNCTDLPRAHKRLVESTATEQQERQYEQGR
jgi:hypothetical protein